MFFMKQLTPNGKWHVSRMDATQHDPEALLRDLYLSRGWADATAQEYEETLAAAKPNEEGSTQTEASPDEGSSE